MASQGMSSPSFHGRPEDELTFLSWQLNQLLTQRDQLEVARSKEAQLEEDVAILQAERAAVGRRIDELEAERRQMGRRLEQQVISCSLCM